MGTGYDCSDPKAHTAVHNITSPQRRWRDTLVAAMTRHGFVNFAQEWWHFSHPGIRAEPYDFPVPRRPGE
jgi:D-alanyl-D-alanine dipeptidase